MSFSNASREARPRPEKWSFFAIPGSACFDVAFPLAPVAVGPAGCGDLPGTAPGGDRSGSVVRGLLPRPAGEILGEVAVGCGA